MSKNNITNICLILKLSYMHRKYCYNHCSKVTVSYNEQSLFEIIKKNIILNNYTKRKLAWYIIYIKNIMKKIFQLVIYYIKFY